MKCPYRFLGVFRIARTRLTETIYALQVSSELKTKPKFASWAERVDIMNFSYTSLDSLMDSEGNVIVIWKSIGSTGNAYFYSKIFTVIKLKI